MAAPGEDRAGWPPPGPPPDAPRPRRARAGPPPAEHRHRHRRQRPGTRRSTGAPVTDPMNDLRDGPRPAAGPAPHATPARRRAARGCPARAWRTRVPGRRRSRPPARPRRRPPQRLPQLRDDLGHDVVVPRRLLHVLRPTARVHQHQPQPPLAHHVRELGIEAQPETSLTSAAPAAAAGRPRRPSWCRWRAARRPHLEPSSTGKTRRSSSSTGTGSLPGRVDSPPTSSRSAPSATSRRPCSTAARDRGSVRHRRRSPASR